MKKVIVVLLCLSSLLLQGCWTTMTKDNPLYADCSSYHNLSYPGGQQANYVTVASASAGRCYGAGGDSVAHARQAAMSICKNNSRPDCTVYAENKKIVLSPTMKDRDMDWDSTFALLTAGLAGAAVYEAGKSEAPANSQYYVPQIQAMASYPSNSSIGTLPSPVARGVVPSAGSSASSNATVASAPSGSVRSSGQCLEQIGQADTGGISTESMKIRNRCNKRLGFTYCVMSSKRGGAFSCADNKFGSDFLRAGDTGIISIMDANPGRIRILSAECVNPDPGSYPSPRNVRFDGSKLVFSGCS